VAPPAAGGAASEPPGAEGTPASEATSAATILEHTFAATLMGTPWSLKIVTADAGQAREAADAAFREVDRLEAMLSEWRAETPIARLNAQAGGEPVQMPAEALRLLAQSVALGEATGGAFDVTWAALRGVWDFQRRPPRLPARGAFEVARALVDYRGLQIDHAAGTARLGRPGAAVGLGGIAKGYAIDRATAVLRARGLTAFVVDGGGDLYLAGEKAPGVPWSVGVRHPRAGGVLGALPARDAAVVSSGDYERFFEIDGVRYHHLIDPATGEPARRSVAVTLMAREATLADALATAAFVLGPEAVERLPARFPNVSLVLLDPSGDVHATPDLRARLPRRWRD
jgi:thiamine biosynthesis lipoprotein